MIVSSLVHLVVTQSPPKTSLLRKTDSLVVTHSRSQILRSFGHVVVTTLKKKRVDLGTRIVVTQRRNR